MQFQEKIMNRTWENVQYQEKLIVQSWENLVSDGQTHGQTDGQGWFQSTLSD